MRDGKRPGSRRARRRGTTAAAVACLLLLTACSGEDPPAPPPKPDRGTALADFETKRLGVAREAFCEELPAAAVERALGAEPTRASTYAPGERVRLSPEVKDVAHEFGCRFRGPRRAEARAWVFAPPVTREQARLLAAEAASYRGCGAIPDAPAFGRSSAATLCTGEKSVVVTFAGLFGDAWLSCSVAAAPSSEEREAMVDRAGRWCVEVARAAAGTPA